MNTTLKPEGHYDLQLGSKGFFTIYFINLEDRNRVMDGSTYLFYSEGLFLKPWKDKFYLKNEDMKVATIWIRFYSLPSEYWDP